MRVAIVGFGIGGGALAVALAGDGHEVTVFEQAASPGPVGAGFLLQPSGQAALASLGAARSGRGRGLADPRVPRRVRAGPHADAAALRPAGSATASRSASPEGVCSRRSWRRPMAAGVRVVTGARIVDARETRDAVVPIDAFGGEYGCVRRPRRGRRDALGAFGGAWIPGRACSCRPTRRCGAWGGSTDRAPSGSSSRPGAWGSWPACCRSVSGRWPASGACVPTDLDALRGRGLRRARRADGRGLPGGALRARGHRWLRSARARAIRPRDAGAPLHGADRPHRRCRPSVAAAPRPGRESRVARRRRARGGAPASSGRPSGAFARWDRRRRWQNARYAYLSRALSPFFQSSHGWLGPARDLALPAMGAVPPLRRVHGARAGGARLRRGAAPRTRALVPWVPSAAWPSRVGRPSAA